MKHWIAKLTTDIHESHFRLRTLRRGEPNGCLQPLRTKDSTMTQDAARSRLQGVVSLLIRTGYFPVAADEAGEGAQLINGEWHMPLWGCDTLQRLIDECGLASVDAGDSYSTENELRVIAKMRGDGRPDLSTAWKAADEIRELKIENAILKTNVAGLASCLRARRAAEEEVARLRLLAG